MEENTKYYQEKLVPIFKRLEIKGFVTPARYSYKEEKLKLFPPFQIHSSNKNIKKAMFSIKLKILEHFSFTKLLVDNDKEIWFHFNTSRGGNKISYNKKNKCLTISSDIEKCKRNDLSKFVTQIIKELTGCGLTQYDGSNLNSIKFDYIKNTFKSAILDVLKSGITDIYFIPIVVPCLAKKIAGIMAVNSIGTINDNVLRNILQTAAIGAMGIFHLQELNEITISHALRSAVAAIMARNMSHNIGSHVLNYLSNPEELDNLWVI